MAGTDFMRTEHESRIADLCLPDYRLSLKRPFHGLRMKAVKSNWSNLRCDKFRSSQEPCLKGFRRRKN